MVKMKVVTIESGDKNMVHLVHTGKDKDDEKVVPIIMTGDGATLATSKETLEEATEGELNVRYASTFDGTPEELRDQLNKAATGLQPAGISQGMSYDADNETVMRGAGMYVKPIKSSKPLDAAAKSALFKAVATGKRGFKMALYAAGGIQLYIMFQSFEADGGMDGAAWAELALEAATFVCRPMTSTVKTVAGIAIDTEGGHDPDGNVQDALLPVDSSSVPGPGCEEVCPSFGGLDVGDVDVSGGGFLDAVTGLASKIGDMISGS